MVKRRQAKYCNLKLVLIFLVIFGHMIEPLNLRMYHWIYAFHMPVFAMLSGMFSTKNRCSWQEGCFCGILFYKPWRLCSGNALLAFAQQCILVVSRSSFVNIRFSNSDLSVSFVFQTVGEGHDV